MHGPFKRWRVNSGKRYVEESNVYYQMQRTPGVGVKCRSVEEPRQDVSFFLLSSFSLSAERETLFEVCRERIFRISREVRSFPRIRRRGEIAKCR